MPPCTLSLLFLSLTALLQVDALGSDQDTVADRQRLKDDLQQVDEEFRTIDVAMTVLRSRADMAKAQLQRLEASLRTLRDRFAKQKQLAAVRRRQYEPIDQGSQADYGLQPPSSSSSSATAAGQRGGFAEMVSGRRGAQQQDQQQQQQHRRRSSAGAEQVEIELTGFGSVEQEIVRVRLHVLSRSP